MDEIAFDSYGGIRLSNPAIQHILAAESVGVISIVRDTGGFQVRVPPQLNEDVMKGKIGYFYANISDEPFIFYGGRSGRLEVAVGVPESSYLLNKLAFRANILAFIVAASSLFAFFVSYLVTAKILSPVRRLGELVEKSDPETVSGSMPVAPSFPNDEIGHLAQTFDRFTERIRESIIREKEFVSDAGHELRTPLTVIRTSAELVLASDGLSEKAQQKLKNILAAADKMDRLTS